MTLHSRGLRSALIFFALAATACESPPTTPPAAPATEEAGACVRLSDEFVEIAERRDRGESRRTQVERAYDTAVAPTTADPDGTVRYLLRAIDFVYGRPEVNAEGIGALVRGSCLVNDEGRAVLYLPQP